MPRAAQHVRMHAESGSESPRFAATGRKLAVTDEAKSPGSARSAWAVRLRELCLWLFVVNLGIALGAGLYEARVVLPSWRGTAASAWPNTGLLFWAYVTTGPLTLLTLASAVFLRRCGEPRKTWWRRAVWVTAAERLVTYAYFIPTMLQLIASGAPQPELDAGLARWEFSNYGRHLLSLAGFLLALKALSEARGTR